MNDRESIEGHISLGYCGNDTYRCQCGETFNFPLLRMDSQTTIRALKDQWEAHLKEVK